MTLAVSLAGIASNATSFNTVTLTSGTLTSTASGTSIDLTGIPSGVKRVTVMFSGVSTNGISALLIQLGTASGVETTGYAGAAGYFGGNPGAAYKGVSFSNGLPLCPDFAGSVLVYGTAVITYIGSNTWTMTVTLGRGDNYIFTGASAKTLTGGTGLLDRIRLTTNGGTDAFDAGSINILYE
jgi:hypothetical protein